MKILLLAEKPTKLLTAESNLVSFLTFFKMPSVFQALISFL